MKVHGAVLARLDEGVEIRSLTSWGSTKIEILRRADAMMTIRNSAIHRQFADTVMVFNGVRKDLDKRAEPPLTVLETYAAFYELGAVNLATQAAVVLQEGRGAGLLRQAARVASSASANAAWKAIVTSSDPAAVRSQATTGVAHRSFPSDDDYVSFHPTATSYISAVTTPKPCTLRSQCVQRCVMDDVPACEYDLSILSDATTESRKRAREEEEAAANRRRRLRCIWP